MWYLLDIGFDLSATFFRIYLAGYTLFIYTSKFITYKDVDTPFFFYWLDLTAFIISIFAMLSYLWRFTEGWVLFAHFFTTVPTTKDYVFTNFASFQNFIQFDQFVGFMSYSINFIAGPRKISVFMDMLMALLFVYAALYYQMRSTWSFFAFFMISIPFDMFLQFLLYPLLPQLDIPFISLFWAHDTPETALFTPAPE